MMLRSQIFKLFYCDLLIIVINNAFENYIIDLTFFPLIFIVALFQHKHKY